MNIEQKAAATLLDKGIKVPVTAPLLLRLFGKRTIQITIRQPYLGTLYLNDLILLKTGLSKEQLEQLASEPGLYRRFAKPMARIVAVSWLNNAFWARLLSRPVGWWFFTHLTNIQLVTLKEVFVVLSGHKAFTNTIRLDWGMRMTQPNLSQTTQGS